MTHMFFLIPSVNEDVINKHDNEQVQVLFEHSIHQIHESCIRIGYSKWNNYKFVMTIPSSWGYFLMVTASDSQLIITWSEDYLWEMTSTLNLVKQVINPRDGILIFYYDLFQLSIVNEHLERTIFFLYEQHWCTP